MGVVLWNQINFTDLGLKLSNDVWSGSVVVDPTITVKHEIGQAGSVKIAIKDLPVKVQDQIAAGLNGDKGKDGLKVEVKLGYLDERSSLASVFVGRIETSEAAGFRLPTAILLSGTEEAAFKLQAVKEVDEGQKPAKLGMPKTTADDAVNRLLGLAKPPFGKIDKIHWVAAEGEDPTSQKRDVHIDGANAFVLLNKLAEIFNAEALVQDGKVAFGSNLTVPPDASPPTLPDLSRVRAFITREDILVALASDKSMVTAQLADFSPFQIGGAKKKAVSERPPPSDVQGFDFTVAGRPALRVGQLVAANITGYKDPFTTTFRILSLTHSYSPDTGYTCTGRAVAFLDSKSGKSNRGQSELARKASPLSVADKIAGKAKEAQTSTSPATDVGRVSAVTAGDHVVTVQYGQESSGVVNAPSVDLDIQQKKDGPKLEDKPVVSPFAWHNVGLSLPAYVGMRAMLSQVRGSRDDTVVTGYLWSNKPKMDKPPAKDGDWWLCLPTELSGDPPQPSGKGANDLTAADGRRVVEAVGLKIAVGKDACTALGTRPSEGDPDVLVITHKSGTTVQIDAGGNVTVDGKQKVVLKAGGVTLTIGNGKVAIT
jgi:hypothetical protein